MWLTSKRPTAVRTARCSAMRPPPLPGYSTGMSQPPKSTILALRARWVALRAVFWSAGAAGVAMRATVPQTRRVGWLDVNPLRGLLMVVAAGIAFYRGWQMRHTDRAWVAFGLGVVALGLAVWHWRRRSS